MEGVTDPAFREVVLGLHPPEVLGGAFTEFVVVSRDQPVPARVLREHLGAFASATPVGLQLMGANPTTLVETARRVEGLGVPLLDLNFGCPAKGALRGCAGSAMVIGQTFRLREPVLDSSSRFLPVSSQKYVG